MSTGPRTPLHGALLSALLGLALASGCEQKMYHAGKLQPYQPDPLDRERSSGRLPVYGTIPLEDFSTDGAYLYGTRRGKPVTEIPVPVTPELLHRGRERYNIYCAPCHDLAGSGDGIIPARGFAHPPTFHSERLRKAPVGHFFNVMTHGYGAMFGYRDRVPVSDRWAITAYIRALQLSQDVPVARLAPEQRRKVEENGT